jgi:hypothetical protein
MNEPVTHNAEVAPEYHDMRYVKTFEEPFDFALFAEILADLANKAVSLQLGALREGAKALNLALSTGALREEELLRETLTELSILTGFASRPASVWRPVTAWAVVEAAQEGAG